MVRCAQVWSGSSGPTRSAASGTIPNLTHLTIPDEPYRLVCRSLHSRYCADTGSPARGRSHVSVCVDTEIVGVGVRIRQVRCGQCAPDETPILKIGARPKSPMQIAAMPAAKGTRNRVTTSKRFPTMKFEGFLGS